METKPLIVIVGETASGKSSLAMSLARKFNGEIISADSWVVYKEFSIGTAKPTSHEQVEVKHHLIDIAEPTEGFNAAKYKHMAQQAIDEIGLRGSLPILVGGTGLYVDSVLFNYSFLPPASSDIRNELNNLSLNVLLQRANKLKLDVSNIDIRNKRRLIRLIESNGQLPKKDKIRQNTLVIGVSLTSEELSERIYKRANDMFNKGLIEEVLHLKGKYGWDIEPMRGIGYLEFQEYFNGTQTLDETKNRIIASTLQLAKRQRTWFKRNNNIQWICKESEAVDLVTTLLNK
jgi:tRNA dimethylallyltransferase